MQLTKSAAEKRLEGLFMDSLPIMEFTIKRSSVAPDWFVRNKGLRRDFMRSLTDSVESLAFLNLSQDEFLGIVMGRSMPANLSIRFRVPLVWGGRLDIDNMFMCRTFPHSHNMDRFIIEQDKTSIIWLPNPVKKVYVPAHTTGGGDGGNATSDRLSQMAAQIAAGNSME